MLLLLTAPSCTSTCSAAHIHGNVYLRCTGAHKRAAAECEECDEAEHNDREDDDRNAPSSA